MRNKGVLPPCDWWDFKYTLVDTIKQGLEGLLNDQITDWDAEPTKGCKEAMEYIIEWTKEFPLYEHALVVRDDEEKEQLSEEYISKYGDIVGKIITKAEYDEFQKRTRKAFELLGKNIHNFWS